MRILWRRRVLLIVLAVAAELFAAGSSWGADPHWATDLGIGVLLEGRGADDPNHLSPALDGSAFTGQFSLARTISERISLGVEVSGGTPFTRAQFEQTATTHGALNSRHHDTFASAVVKYTVGTIELPGSRPGAHIEVDVVGGGGPAWRRTLRQGVVVDTTQPATTATVNDQFDSVAASAAVGVDGLFWLNARTAMLTTVRYEILADNDRDAAGFIKTGASASAVAFAFGARFRF